MDSLWLWLKAIHVVGTVMLMGPAFGYGIIAALGQREPQHRAFANQLIGKLNRRMFNPGLAIVIASGLIMGFLAGPAFFAKGWVIASCVLIVLAIVYSLTVHRNDQKVVRRLAMEAAQASEPDPAREARIVSVRKRLKIAGKGIAYTYGVIVLLMVLKPF